jgi:pilus assembly protein CpaB
MRISRDTATRGRGSRDVSDFARDGRAQEHSRARRSRQMNPRQRQGLLLVVIAAAGLIGVFLLIANYVSTISKQVGPKTVVLALARPLQPYQPVTIADLRQVSLPQKWAPTNAIGDESEALGLVSPVTLPAGTELEQGMLAQAPALAPGHREIAIMVDDETGVAGQIQPGALVDIVATYQANGQATRSSAQVVVAGAPVLNVGQLTGSSSGSGVPVTFSLTPEQVLKVSYAESFAQKVRLSIVAPGTSGRSASPSPYAPVP